MKTNVSRPKDRNSPLPPSPSLTFHIHTKKCFENSKFILFTKKVMRDFIGSTKFIHNVPRSEEL